MIGVAAAAPITTMAELNEADRDAVSVLRTGQTVTRTSSLSQPLRETLTSSSTIAGSGSSVEIHTRTGSLFLTDDPPDRLIIVDGRRSRELVRLR